MSDGSDAVQGRWTLNEVETSQIVGRAPQRRRLQARSGENVIDAHIVAEDAGTGRWRFDFRDTAEFVPGSLRVSRGEILTQSQHAVVFRVSGTPGGSSIRFSFRVD